MAVAIQSDDTFLLKESESGGYLRWCKSLAAFDFPTSITEANLCKIAMRNGKGTVELGSPVDISVFIKAETSEGKDAWHVLTKKNGLHKGCADTITLNESVLDSTSLYKVGEHGNRANATYSMVFHIGTEWDYLWDICTKIRGCKDILTDEATNGILERENFNNNNNASTFTLIRITTEEDVTIPTNPACGTNCGDPYYIINGDNLCLHALDVCHVAFRPVDGTDRQLWYLVEEGPRAFEGFVVIYNAYYNVPLVKSRGLGEGIAMDGMCGGYIAEITMKEWSIDVNPANGFHVLRLSYSNEEKGEYYLSVGANNTAVASVGIGNAELITVNTNPQFDGNPVCGAVDTACAAPGDCCQPALFCGEANKCEPVDAEDTGDGLGVWIYILIAVGGLIFIFLFVKILLLIFKTNTSKLFKDPIAPKRAEVKKELKNFEAKS